LTVALAVLGASASWYALGMAVCLSVALIRRAGGYVLLVESAPVLIAGTTGLFVLLVHLPHMFSGTPPWFGTTLAGLIGGMILVVGIALAFRRETDPAPQQAWFRVVAAACMVASVPLLLGVYGVLDQMFSVGRHL
jgi:hypothetical protein